MVYVSSKQGTGSDGVTPGSPSGSGQGNNGGSFAAIPNSTIDFTNGFYSFLRGFPYQPHMGWWKEEHFMTNNNEWTFQGTLSVDQANPNNPQAHPGQVRLNHTAVNTGTYTMKTISGAGWFAGKMTYRQVWIITPIALSSGTEEHQSQIGWHNVVGAGAPKPTDGIYLDYDPTTYGDQRYRFIVKKAGTETVVDSGVTAVALRWITWAFEVNENATSVQFYIGDATPVLTAVGSAVTTFIPDTVACIPAMRFRRTIATTAAATGFHVDYFGHGGKSTQTSF